MFQDLFEYETTEDTSNKRLMLTQNINGIFNKQKLSPMNVVAKLPRSVEVKKVSMSVASSSKSIPKPLEFLTKFPSCVEVKKFPVSVASTPKKVEYEEYEDFLVIPEGSPDLSEKEYNAAHNSTSDVIPIIKQIIKNQEKLEKNQVSIQNQIKTINSKGSE